MPCWPHMSGLCSLAISYKLTHFSVKATVWGKGGFIPGWSWVTVSQKPEFFLLEWTRIHSGRKERERERARGNMTPPCQAQGNKGRAVWGPVRATGLDVTDSSAFIVKALSLSAPSTVASVSLLGRSLWNENWHKAQSVLGQEVKSSAHNGFKGVAIIPSHMYDRRKLQQPQGFPTFWS